MDGLVVHDDLVLVVERLPVPPIHELDVAEDALSRAKRQTEEAVHDGMPSRKSVEPRLGAQVSDPHRTAISDDSSQHCVKTPNAPYRAPVMSRARCAPVRRPGHTR